MISVKANYTSAVVEPSPVQAPIRPLVVIENRSDMAMALAQARRDQGMTCEQLDEHAGFSDRYTAKLEHGDKPSGRKALHISAMGEIWVQALGFRLCLVPAERLDEIGYVTAPRAA